MIFSDNDYGKVNDAINRIIEEYKDSMRKYEINTIYKPLVVNGGIVHNVYITVYEIK